MWKPTDELTLFWCETNLGTVSDFSADQPTMWGDYAPSLAANSFRDFFAVCVQDPPLENIDSLFDSSLLDDQNWYVFDQDESRCNIYLPAVFWDEGNIAWHWRQLDDDGVSS